MRRRRAPAAVFAAVLAAAALMTALAPAQAQEERRFRDWTLRCDLSAQTRQRVCWIYNDATVNGEGLPEPLSISASVGFPVGAETLGIVFHLNPPFAAPDSMLTLNVDDDAVAEMAIAPCGEFGCQIAQAGDASDAVINAFKHGVEGRFLVSGPAGAQVEIPLSLLGFTRALDALQSIIGT